jgi:hypothetical protein
VYILHDDYHAWHREGGEGFFLFTKPNQKKRKYCQKAMTEDLVALTTVINILLYTGGSHLWVQSQRPKARGLAMKAVLPVQLEERGDVVTLCSVIEAWKGSV